MPAIDHILQSVFQLQQFRLRQREIIDDVLNGNDVVCIMPTGAGKSLCFQLPAVALGGLTLIVSPLISLMTDQVRQLRQLNISAMFLNSSQDAGIQREVMRRVAAGFTGLLYVAPERFSAPMFQRLLSQLRPKLFVVDEAHCVSFWGHDFRPEYMRLAEVRRQLGSPVTLAVTATATPTVRRDIATMLALRSPKLHVTGFDRPNLAYSCRRFQHVGEKDAALLRYLSRRKGSGIVYCATRRAVEEMSALFEERFPDRTIIAYHAGMDQGARRKSQTAFMASENCIVVATNAFGMGINKPDLRFVAHYNLPGSVESYYQEAGRAGRDGKPAECPLFFSGADLRTQNFFIDKIGDNNPALGKHEIERLQKNARQKLYLMLTYASTVQCRRRQILEYFGDDSPITDCRCDACQNLANHRYKPDSPRTTFGGSSSPQQFAGGRATRREAPVEESRRVRRSSAADSPAASSDDEPMDRSAESRFEALRQVRLELAKENSWPAFCILHDRVLREVARTAPNSIMELAAIKGVGATKAEKFGPKFLAALKQ